MVSVAFGHIIATHWTAADHLREPVADDNAVPSLYPFQRKAVRAAQRVLKHWRGVILADEVGLGKSYEALALARELGREVWLTCPTHLIPQWRALAKKFNAEVTVVSHARLSRGSDPTPAQDALLVVDEAHRFRNSSTQRYDRLARHCVGRDTVLLTATPIQNHPRDLLALVHLFLGKGEVESLVGVPWRELWERPASDGVAWSQLVANVMVRRTREDVSAHPPSTALWPHRTVTVHTETHVPVGLAALPHVRSAMLVGEPTSLFERVFLKRLASSPEAALDTVRRCRSYLLRLDEASAAGGWLSRQAFRAAFGDDPEFQGAQAVFPFWYDRSDRRVPDLPRRLAQLGSAITQLQSASITGTSRWQELRETIRTHRRVVVFTDYASTAMALFRGLSDTTHALLWTGSTQLASPARRSNPANCSDTLRRSPTKREVWC